MDANWKRSLILEHYQNPVGRGLIADERYCKLNMNNESCVDEIDLMLLVEDGIIQDIRFDGEACAICTSSTSVMIHTLIGKTIAEALEICKHFNHMIEEEEYQSELLGEAIIYDDIYKQPNRKKCALLSWWGIEKLLKEKVGK